MDEAAEKMDFFTHRIGALDMGDKEKIIDLFNTNVKGKRADTSRMNVDHDGKGGHWLERMMGVKANASNSPDLYGYEMKNHTGSKTTFGDWSADSYIYKDKDYNFTRDNFLAFFGQPNKKKEGRLSWSGNPAPVIKKINQFGQILLIDQNSNILAQYNFSKDQRKEKFSIIPANLQIDNLTIALWKKESLKKKLEKKFNQKGWFKCIKHKEGLYESIVFGDPISFETWIKFVKSGDVFFDSGMYQGNKRPYSQWRANNSFWDKLITSRY